MERRLATSRFPRHALRRALDMALLLIDGFDHYLTADKFIRWNSETIDNGNSVRQTQVINSGGRVSGGYLSVPWTGSSVSKILRADRSNLVAGFAFRVPAPGNAFPQAVFGYLSGASRQFEISINTSSQLYVTRNGTTVQAGIGASSLSQNAWYFVEFKVNFHPTAGSYVVRLDGNVIFSGSGLNTAASGTASANAITLGNGLLITGFGGNSPLHYDDLYVLEADSGSGLSDFIGDCRVQTLLPTGAGTTTGLSKGGAATTNWQSVNEATPDTTTTVFANTAGLYDTYQYGDLVAVTNTVYAVAQSFVSQRDDTGFRRATARIRSGGTEADFAAPIQPLTGAYSVQQQIQETNPVTGAAWTVSQVNAMEMGPKIAS